MLKKELKWERERERESKTAKLNKHTQKRAHFEDLNLKLIKIISPH